MAVRSFVAGILVGAIGAAAVTVAVALASWFHGTLVEQQPALIRDLPTQTDQITPAFTERLRARFPVGSAESVLIQELSAEKFRPEWILPNQTRIAVFTASQLVCRNDWRVFWSADQDGKITMINGSFGAICS